MSLLTLVLCLAATGCGGVWDYLWDRPAVTDVDPDLLVIPGSAGPEDTMQVFEGAVIYTGEAHSGTDIYYIGTGERRNRIIVIDAGRQGEKNVMEEPIGPDASQMVAGMAEGAVGAHSGVAEHQLCLDVALLLRDRLIQRGYSVVMIRETANVDISDKARAAIANKYNAAAYVRIFANGSEDANIRGGMAVCQSPKNPYPPCAATYADSRLLAEEILNAYCDNTGMRHLSVGESDDEVGINWSQVPTMMLKMGFMTNESDDMFMALDYFKQKAADGIADGIDAYMEEIEWREAQTVESETASTEPESTATDVGDVTDAVTYPETAEDTQASTQPQESNESDETLDTEAVTETQAQGDETYGESEIPDGDTQAFTQDADTLPSDEGGQSASPLDTQAVEKDEAAGDIPAPEEALTEWDVTVDETPPAEPALA